MAKISDISIPRSALHELGMLLTHATHLQDIADALNRTETSKKKASIMIGLSKELAIPETDLKGAINSIANLARIRSKYKLSTSELTDIFDRAIKRDADQKWTDKYLDLWSKYSGNIEGIIDAMTSDHPLVMSLKAETLTYDR